jgi:hypothetical protein
MGLGAMFVLLVVSIVLLPVVVRYIARAEPHFIISGFQDLKAESNPSGPRPSGPSGPSGLSLGSTAQLPTWRPDPNTDYVCRSPHGGDQPCPEGTFCDGSSQSCVPLYVGGEVPSTGYFS